MKASKSVYEIINERIIEEFENGIVPWRKPWKNFDGSGDFVPPQNFISRIPYKGINFVLLLNRFEQPYYLTFNQIKSLGGKIIKGEKSFPVVFWKPVDHEIKDKDGNIELDRTYIFRYYKVFNITQTTGIDYEPVGLVENIDELKFDRIQRAEDIIKGYKDGPRIFYGGNDAYYYPATDQIHIPEPKCFDNPESFFSVLFHEASHSVGHPSRLNRKGIAEVNHSDDHELSYEELIAEFSASYLCGHCGIHETTIKENVAYIHNWLSVLNEHEKWIVNAASAGQKSSEYILGV
ncbi:ArdC family protein [Saccharicrinis sp. GN24d3]|uniref:ArdC family protein n=1 Tax=Saccharicrinis sp. GN24d3 TaxID=3458416 RepID=UPI004036E61A